MKPALRGLLVLGCALVAIQSGAAASAGTRQVTRPSSAIFLNSRVGLIGVGYCVPGSSRCTGGAVERTTDGGRTYRVVLRTSGPVRDLERVGSQGAIATPVSGKAWHTLDGGRTWRSFDFRPFFWATPRLAVRFDAYFQRDTAKLALRVTHDGGRTFRRLADPCNTTVTFNAYADLVTPKLWWIACVGQPAGGLMDKAIFRTRDGGRTWQELAANLLTSRGPVHGGIRAAGYPNGITFAKDGFGLLTESQGTLYVSRDGGLHFTGKPKVDRPDVDFCAGASALPGGAGYALLVAGLSARLVATQDFGRTWRVVRRWQS